MPGRVSVAHTVFADDGTAQRTAMMQREESAHIQMCRILVDNMIDSTSKCLVPEYAQAVLLLLSSRFRPHILRESEHGKFNLVSDKATLQVCIERRAQRRICRKFNRGSLDEGSCSHYHLVGVSRHRCGHGKNSGIHRGR